MENRKIDPEKWSITEPSEGCEITENDELVFKTDSQKYYIILRQTKISRKLMMERYDISKGTVLKLEKQGKLTPLYYNNERRRAYYDIRELESIFKPAE